MLKGFRSPTEIIGLPGGGNFAVRGLSLADITTLTERHLPELRLFVDAVLSVVDEQVGYGALAAEAIKTAPGVCLAIIAISTGEKDVEDEVKGLPAATQLTALEKIIALTFAGEPDGLKKLIEAVTRQLGVVNKALTGPASKTKG